MRCIFIFLVLGAMLFPVCADSMILEDNPTADVVGSSDTQKVLEKISGDISVELEKIKTENEISARLLASAGISGDPATAIISDKIKNLSYAHSSLFISSSGVVTAAVPLVYGGMVGSNLGYQQAVQLANNEKTPLISDLFYLEEGFYGLSISYPIFSADNTYLGYTDATIRPEEFFRQSVVPVTEQTGYDVIIVQKDGMTVYETNTDEIGRNILTNPLYDTPEIHEAVQQVVEKPSGTTRYTFWNTQWSHQVPRELTWITLKAENQEWRLGIIRDLAEKSDNESVSTNLMNQEDLNTSIADMVDYVQNAAEYARSVGQSTATEAFNNLSGPYVSGSRYLFAYDTQGTCLALPYQPGLIGENRMNLTDSNGVSIMPALLETAKQGGGFLYYIYPNPSDNFQNELKIVRVEPVNSEWFIGSGIYVKGIPIEFDTNEIRAVIDRVKNAAVHAAKVGEDEALRDFNDLNSSFIDGEGYIFAVDYDGYATALPHQPEFIGKNRMNLTDLYGSHIVVHEIAAAKNGGGFVYIIYYNPVSKKDELKLCYVLPAGNDWLVGSGTYSGINFEG